MLEDYNVVHFTIHFQDSFKIVIIIKEYPNISGSIELFAL